nr:EOG090X0AJ3 [Eurycercus lamellatus]
MTGSANSRVAGWRLEDIDDNLAADFDGSLSGLGVDLSVASYNMSGLAGNSLPHHYGSYNHALVDGVGVPAAASGANHHVIGGSGGGSGSGSGSGGNNSPIPTHPPPHYHHFAAAATNAYHPYSYNYGANNHAYAHYPPASNPSAPSAAALELTRRHHHKMISRSPASTWRSNSPWEIEGRMGNNPSPPQQTERASSEGRSVTNLTGHGHPHGSDQSGGGSVYSGHPFQHMLHQHSAWSGQDVSSGAGPITGGVGTGSASSLASSSSNEGMSSLSQQQAGGSTVGTNSSSYHGEKYKYDRLNEADANADNRFQYVLAAATSIATKVNEESLTYLNQGQPYEIKMKKLGDLSNFRGKLLRSVVRLCFHERRLQYMEREQIAAWRMSRPGDRIVEIDVPLSYGIYDVVQDNNNLNVVEFVWDPTKEVGVYIKVNCISTEFTPKKHGGEKGVPFRIQVETYSHGDGDGTPKRLHVAGCQIKVFKLKGADRKHKQDREKIFKRPIAEQEKYQPSCECTILAEIPLELVYTSAIVPVGAAASNGNNNQPAQTAPPTNVVTPPAAAAGRTYSPTELHKSQSFTSEGCPSESPLGHETDNVESPDQSQVFHAVFLENLSCIEIANKLAALVQLSSQHILDVYIEGPCGIHVLVTDDVVQNMKDESMYTVELLPDQTSDRYRLLLKPTSPH